MIPRGETTPETRTLSPSQHVGREPVSVCQDAGRMGCMLIFHIPLLSSGMCVRRCTAWRHGRCHGHPKPSAAKRQTTTTLDEKKKQKEKEKGETLIPTSINSVVRRSMEVAGCAWNANLTWANGKMGLHCYFCCQTPKYVLPSHDEVVSALKSLRVKKGTRIAKK